MSISEYGYLFITFNPIHLVSVVPLGGKSLNFVVVLNSHSSTFFRFFPFVTENYSVYIQIYYIIHCVCLRKFWCVWFRISSKFWRRHDVSSVPVVVNDSCTDESTLSPRSWNVYATPFRETDNNFVDDAWMRERIWFWWANRVVGRRCGKHVYKSFKDESAAAAVNKAAAVITMKRIQKRCRTIIGTILVL